MKEIIIDYEVTESSIIVDLPISANGIIEMDFTYLDDEISIEDQNILDHNDHQSYEDEDPNDDNEDAFNDIDI
ncbi:hypothetical protein [Winogradskyella tangerina]|uniref:hypothetical protein n=1 Tax=Winogradskyella tangerina TaxID=2023240 RepID=UPI000DBE7C1C|nr:hypothetical protein [Winogradskyella tangerina]